MAKVVEFTKAAPVNGEEFKKGDTLSVSDSIAAGLIDRKEAKVFVPKKPKKSKE